jgi:hypothetical protein
MRHSLKTEVLQQVLNYLANQPYAQVAKLVTDIQADAKLIEEQAAPVLNDGEPLQVVEGSITDVTDVA